jgi:hypothetical protein
MNKALRHQVKMLKFKKRIKKYGISDIQLADSNNNFYAFRSHGAPCSCWCCKGQKYNRAKSKTIVRHQLKN